MSDDAPTVEAARERLVLAFLSANGINAAIDALIAAVRSDALRGSADPRTADWQPIETAPKDGTWIIILMGNGQVWKASWGRDRANEMHWCTDMLSLAGCVVTHWMPLPAPPSTPRQET